MQLELLLQLAALLEVQLLLVRPQEQLQALPVAQRVGQQLAPEALLH